MQYTTSPKPHFRKVSFIPEVEYPPTFVYLAQQGCKNPSKIVVKPHQTVQCGDMLARSESINSQNIFSSVGGTIKNITSFRYCEVISPTQAIELHFGGKFKSFERDKDASLNSISYDKALTSIKGAGIFDPDTGNVSTKLNRIMQGNIHYIIINAMELAPYAMLEEKILEKHYKEISETAIFLQNLHKHHNKKSATPKIMVLSGNKANRKQAIHSIRLLAEEPKNILGKKMSLQISTSNISWKNDIQVFQVFFSQKRREEQNPLLFSEILTLSPSALLAIHDIIFRKKPFIEKYIQLIINNEETYIIKTPIGMPLFYLLALPKYVRQKTSHIFLGNFIEKNTMINFATPVSKHFSHIFALTDDEFILMHKKMRTVIND